MFVKIVKALIIILFSCLNVYSIGKNFYKLDCEFTRVEEILLVGNKEHPLFSAYNLYITQKNIYIPDPVGNTVNVYSKTGNHIINLKTKLEMANDKFSMPYGVVVDEDGNIYINDRGNPRILVFDKNYNLINQYKINRQLELLLLANKSIICVAVAPCFKCNINKYCLIIELDKLNGRKLKTFGVFEKEYITYSWAASVHKEKIYICNKYDNEIFVFGKNRKVIKIIRLDYPAVMNRNNFKKSPKSMLDLLNNKRTLNQTVNITIGRIASKDGRLVIQYRERGGVIRNTNYYIQIINSKGKFVSKKFSAPGEMYAFRDLIYFVEELKNEEFGKVKIYGYRIF